MSARTSVDNPTDTREPTDPALDHDLDKDLADLIAGAEAELAAAADANICNGQRGSSWSIPVNDGALAKIPVWSSRAVWQCLLRDQLATEQGTAVCRQHRVAVEKVYAVGVVMSLYADSITGRRVTASVDTIAEKAGVSRSTVQRTRRVLAAVGFGVELERGRHLTTDERLAAQVFHGRHQHRAASVWALTHPQVKGRDAPPRRGEVCRESSGTKYSPTRASARRETQSPRRQQPTAQQARLRRPLPLQRTAAELVARAPGLDRGHIGTICDVLARVGIDPERWSGRDIVTVLDADSQQRGWVWPDRVKHPAGLLRSRLARIDWTRESPSERSARLYASQKAEQDARMVEAARARENAASGEQRATAMAQIRAALRRTR